MGEMKEINIEDIMKDIRNEISEKGYTNDMLSFNDINVDTSDLGADKFDKELFKEEIYSMNAGWNVQTYHPFIATGSIKSKLIVFVKKVIRKFIKFYVEPIVNEQNAFNAVVVRSFNLLECYINENSNVKSKSEINNRDIVEQQNEIRKNQELKKQVERLIQEQELLKQEILELKKALGEEEKY